MVCMIGFVAMLGTIGFDDGDELVFRPADDRRNAADLTPADLVAGRAFGGKIFAERAGPPPACAGPTSTRSVTAIPAEYDTKAWREGCASTTFGAALSSGVTSSTAARPVILTCAFYSLSCTGLAPERLLGGLAVVVVEIFSIRELDRSKILLR